MMNHGITIDARIKVFEPLYAPPPIVTFML
jgi:hypothetical protein